MLSLFGYIYGKIANVRNMLYDKGVFDVFDARVRVISAGNISAGGTGKTPLVAYIARILADRGEKVCILTRGYGRIDAKKRVLVTDGKQINSDAKHSGDEPFELANKLLGKAIIIADADRVAAASWARRKFGVTVFLLDDGFQHRKVGRGLDIVCIDATDDFKDAKMLPEGRLREPLSGLKRAGAVVITRANLVADISNLRLEISTFNDDAPVFIAKNKISNILRLEDFHAKSQRSPSKFEVRKAFAFCGIGNPNNFFDQLQQEKMNITGTKAFRDHHIYTQSDVADIEKKARETSSAILLTTAKDAVKLSSLRFEIPCFVVEIEMVLDAADAFKNLI